MQIDADSLIKTGIKHDQAGRLDEAAGYYRQVLQRQPDHPYALHLLGALSLRQGDPKKAIKLIGSAIRINDREPVFYLFLGQALQQQGELEAALEAFQQALSLAPGLPPAEFRRATVLLALRRPGEALSAFKTVLESGDRFAPATLAQARSLRDVGDFDLAERLLRLLIECHPGMREAHAMLGFVLIARDKLAEAKDIFTGLFIRERGAGWDARPYREQKVSLAKGGAPASASPFFFENLIGHIEYLIARGRLHPSFARLANTYRDILKAHAGKTGAFGLISLSRAETEGVQAVLTRALHYADSRPVSASAVNPSLDGEKLERDYRESPWRMTFFDDFLTADALASLREFCLESTIFFRQSHNTFVSSYLEEGFNCSILYQIATELKRKLPGVLGPLHLQNIWCYRQAPEGDGVRPHSDQAAVTFNFWITPDSANLQPGHGGLILYDREQPLDWDWYKTNAQKDDPRVLRQINDYLQGAQTRIIPYRENRAVMFHSNMFHCSDRFCFRQGYENSRMNITMLFGRHPGLAEN